MFFLIGLGLGDPTDVGVLGQKIIEKCERVYLEAYTSILLNGADSTLEAFYGKKIHIADREQVEVGAGDLLKNADTQDVALLVVGDPLSATTHSDLMLRAKNNGTPMQVLSNASVLTAAATTGLRIERFGEVVSIPYWEEGWKPESFYDKIQANLQHGLHTLCLLDIKVKEQTVENIIKKRKIFEPPRFMRTHEASQQLLAVLQRRGEDSGPLEGLGPDTPCVACVRLGTDRQQNLLTSLQGMSSADLGEPLHSMVVCAPMSEAETRDVSALATCFTGTPSPASSGLSQLCLVGIGLTLADVSAKGLGIILKANHVFIEETSRHVLRAVLGSRDIQDIYSDVFAGDDLSRLKEKIDLETCGVSGSHCQEVLELLKSGQDVVVISWGDPLVLTDLPSLLSQLICDKIRFSVVHNASLINTVASCGLQLYSFGEVINFPPNFSVNEDVSSITKTLDSAFYKRLLNNLRMGWHSLCILHSSKEGTFQYWRPSDAAKVLMRLSARNGATETSTPVALNSTASSDAAFEVPVSLRELSVSQGTVSSPSLQNEDSVLPESVDSCRSVNCGPDTSNIDKSDVSLASAAIEAGQRVVVVRLVERGQPEYRRATLKDLASLDDSHEMGVCALIVVGKTHPLEEECLAALTRPF